MIHQNSYFKRVHQLTCTRFWINNPTRKQAKEAIEHGAINCTLNPSYVSKMMFEEEERPLVMQAAKEIIASEKDDTKALLLLQQRLAIGIAEIFAPLYNESHGRCGLVSIQSDPFDERCETIVAYARENVWAAKNIIAKIPVIPEGLRAMEELVPEGIIINGTEVMSIRQALDVHDLYEKLTKDMANPPIIFFSHIMGIYNEYLAKAAKKQGVEIYPDILKQAGIAVARKIHEIFRQKNSRVQFISGGARSLEDFTEMVGADANVTINWKGSADLLLQENPPVIQRFYQPTPASVLDELLEKLPDFRKAYLYDALKPEEYEEFGPVVAFRNAFEQGWSTALNEISALR